MDAYRGGTGQAASIAARMPAVSCATLASNAPSALRRLGPHLPDLQLGGSRPAWLPQALPQAPHLCAVGTPRRPRGQRVPVRVAPARRRPPSAFPGRVRTPRFAVGPCGARGRASALRSCTFA
eukprot:1214236-Pleurochrysis_carterae.AAC.4